MLAVVPTELAKEFYHALTPSLEWLTDAVRMVPAVDLIG